MLEELFGLKGKVALVVGASKGLGKAMSLALAGAGADVALASRSEHLMEEIKNDIKDLGRDSMAIVTDIASERDISAMVDQVIDKYDHIDILVNNAGIYDRKKALDVTADDWDRTFDINVRGFFLSCRMVGEHMIKRNSGKIINLTSVLGKRAAHESLAYASSKAAITQLTRSFAFEFAPHNVHVNGIAPGWFETEMTQDELANPRSRKFFLFKTPMGRFAKPEELGGAVIFLASKASDYMTGEIIFVDGGISIW